MTHRKEKCEIDLYMMFYITTNRLTLYKNYLKKYIYSKGTICYKICQLLAYSDNIDIILVLEQARVSD